MLESRRPPLKQVAAHVGAQAERGHEQKRHGKKCREPYQRGKIEKPEGCAAGEHFLLPYPHTPILSGGVGVWRYGGVVTARPSLPPTWPSSRRAVGP